MIHSLHTFEFPTLLYGDAPTTRAAWKKVLSAAWKGGSWDAATTDLEMSALEELPCQIIISIPRRDNCARDETHWWPVWVAKERPSQLKRHRFLFEPVPEQVASLLAREQSFILEGMRHLWFTVGLLGESIGVDRAIPYSRFQSPRETCELLLVPMLRRFIGWLPELLSLRDRYASDAIHYCRHPVTRHFWLFGIMDAAIRCGYRFDTRDWTATVNSVHGGDPVRALVESGIIERDGERFRLREDTREPCEDVYIQRSRRTGQNNLFQRGGT